MAVQAVGLKTHIWNNNIKSMLFLLLYPILITGTYLFLLGTFFLVIYWLLSGDGAGNHNSAFVFWKFYKYFALQYWYIPYIIISIFLLIVFYKNLNQLNIHPGYIAITRKKHRALYETLENLCISRGLSMPFFFILKDRSCNAYSSGLSKHTYKIVLTYGLLQKLNKKEVETVLAHELTHLINGDTRLMFITNTVSHMFNTLTNFIGSLRSTSPYVPNKKANSSIELYFQRHRALSKEAGCNDSSADIFYSIIYYVLKLFSLGIVFTQLFISKKREFIADAGAIELTKDPHSLITALHKVEHAANDAYHPDVIQDALFHFEKLGSRRSHPPIQTRIAAIQVIARTGNVTVIPWSNKILKAAKHEKVEEVW